MKCVPLTYMSNEAHAYEKHVHEIGARKMHACEMYVRETRSLDAHKKHVCEMHAYELYAPETCIQ
jgi:hypothetical protein